MAATQQILTTLDRISLKRHLVDGVTPQIFEVVSEKIADLADNEVLCSVDYVHIAAAFTDLMREDAEIPMPPFKIGDTVGGAVVGTVLTRSPTTSLRATWCSHSPGGALTSSLTPLVW